MDDLKVRITWVNDEASLRSAMQRAQQLLSSAQGGAGYGTVAGVPTPAAVAAQGGIRAANPAQLLNAQGQPIGSSYVPPANVAPTTAAPPMAPAGGGGGGGGGAARNAAGRSSHLSGILGYFGRSIAVRGAFGALGAIGEVAGQQQSLSDLNRRIGESISKYGDFETQVLRTGLALGATRQQMIEVTNQFASMTGRMGSNGALQGAVRGAFETAKTLGIQPGTVAGYEGGLSQFMQGGNTDFNKLRAALELGVQNGMRGREDELVKEIQDLTTLVGQRMPTIDVQQMMQIQAFTAALNSSGIQGLMGARGAQVIGSVDQFLQGKGSPAQQALLYRALYAQSGGTTGALGLAYQTEEGIANPNNIDALRGLIGGLTAGRPIEISRALVGGTLGISQHQAEALIQAAPNMTNDQLSQFMKAQAQSPELTAQDKNTEAMVDMGRSMQELAEVILPAWVSGAKELTGELRGLGKTITVFTGVMPLIGNAIVTLAQLAGINSVTGGALGGIAGKYAGGALGTLGKVGLATGTAVAGFSIGDFLGTSVNDNFWVPGLRSDVGNAVRGMGFFDMVRSIFDPNFAQQVYNQRNPKMAFGGIVTTPTTVTLGDGGGAEAVVPLGPLTGGSSIADMAKRLNGLIGGSGNSWQAFAAQISVETGNGQQMYGNNPFNLRPIPGGWPGQVGVSPGGFAMFDSLDSGIQAAAMNYRAGNYGYGAVTAAAAMGDPMAVAHAIEASGWDAGRYGSGGGMYPGSISKMIGGDFSGGTVNHYLEVAVRQPDGSTDRYKMNLTSPYRNVVTSPDWGVSSIF